MVYTRFSTSLHVPTIDNASASTVFDEADIQGASTKAATEAAQDVSRAALVSTAPPGQVPFSAAPDLDGAEIHAGSDTSPFLEALDDDVIQVDDDNEESLLGNFKEEHDQIQGDPDDPDAPPSTPDLDLDDNEDALDVVASYLPLPVNKNTQVY